MHLLFCDSCKEYTLKQECPTCKKSTRNPEPAKFSPQDKYGEYRRKMRIVYGKPACDN